jgi:hypothetical protein
MSTSSASSIRKRRHDNLTPSSTSAKHHRAGNPKNGSPSKPLISMEAFVSNNFYLLVVQEDDELSQRTLEENYASNSHEM